MSDQRKHYRLGIFVVLAFLVFIGLLVMLGAGKWMTTQVQLETYFDESVQGIDVGYADVYSRDLPNQWIDVSSVPNGDYWLEITTDPDNRIQESNETNNTDYRRITLDKPPLG